MMARRVGLGGLAAGVVGWAVLSEVGGAPIARNLADLGSGVEVRTSSQLLGSDPRDATGGLFSNTEPGNVLFADIEQSQVLDVVFPSPVRVRAIQVECSPWDPPRRLERVRISALSVESDTGWSVLADEDRPEATAWYGGFDRTTARLRFDFGRCLDGVGDRVIEIRVFDVPLDELRPRLRPRPHSLQTPFPGKVELDAWGWHGAITYQRDSREGVGLDYFRESIIDESYAWGANLLEVYPPYFFPQSWPFEWPDGDAIPRPESYVFWDTPSWRVETFRELHRLAHERRMLVQWFCHPEIVPGERVSATFDDPDKIRENLSAVRKIGRDYSDALRDGWRDCLDGFGHEHWFVDAGGRTAAAGWTANPGMYFYSTHNWHPMPEPAYSKSMMCAGSWDLRGRDDEWLFPGDFGSVPLSYQADSRTFGPPPDVWAGWSRYGGGTHPDWIAEQVTDFARRRLRSGGRPDATAIWWLGEPSPTLPPEYRTYVYGVCQDPMRSAVAARLRTTGVGGHMDLVGTLRRSGIRRRYDFPAASLFIQNNYMRLYRDATFDTGVLFADPNRVANYGRGSGALRLSGGFFQTRVDGGAEEAETVFEFGDPDGASSEFRPVFVVPVAGSVTYVASEVSLVGSTVFSAGEWDGSNADLRGEGGYEAAEVLTVQAGTAEGVPGLLAPPPRGPREVTLRIPLAPGDYRLELGQRGTGASESVLVFLDDRIVGRMQTVETGDIPAGHAGAMHALGPIRVREDGTHELSLRMPVGDGFHVDACRLAYMGALSGHEAAAGAEPYEPACLVDADSASAADVPAALGRCPYALPEELALSALLEPGTYRLEVGLLPGDGPTSVDVFLGERYLGGYAVAGDDRAVEVPFCASRGGREPLRLSAKEGAGHGFDFIRLVRVSRGWKTARVVEPAGHFAAFEEELYLPTTSGPLRQTTRYSMVADSPIVMADVWRRAEGPASPRTVMPLPGYDLIESAVPAPGGGSVGTWVFRPRTEGRPDLAVLAVRDGGFSRGGGSPGEGAFDVSMPFEGEDRFRMALVLLDGLYSRADLPALAAWLAQDEPRVELRDGRAVVENPFPVPLATCVRVAPRPLSPYYVCERGSDGVDRWAFRGAQESGEQPGTDLLRVYLPPKGACRVMADGYIDGLVRPGWGCQYVMALSRIEGAGGGVRLDVDVLSLTPFLFAPRVEVSGRVASVSLDGKPWHYFDENVVFLPGVLGCYSLDVRFGEPTVPHLCRTSALVTGTTFEGGVLGVEVGRHDWCPQLPEGMEMAGLIALAGRGVEGADGAVVGECAEGRVMVHFAGGFRLLLKDGGSGAGR